MSENKHPGIDTIDNHPELVQFKDGKVALGWKKDGSEINLNMQKYGRALKIPGMDDIGIIKLRDGTKVAIGDGVAVLLPEMNEDGSYVKPSDGWQARALGADGENDATLPNIVIGQPWSAIGGDAVGEIDSIILQYKFGPADDRFEQIPLKSPFTHAKDITREVMEKMVERGVIIN